MVKLSLRFILFGVVVLSNLNFKPHPKRSCSTVLKGRNAGPKQDGLCLFADDSLPV